MENKNPNNQNFKTAKIEVRGNRKVKDIRKSKVLDSKENLETDSKVSNAKKKNPKQDF